MSVSDETTTVSDGIILSDAAAAKVKALLEQEGREDLALRVAVQPGGCSGLRYQLFFDERSLDSDVVKDFGGVKVVTDRMSAPYLGGASIDFVDTIEKQGFTIDNERDGFLRLRRLVQLNGTAKGRSTSRGDGPALPAPRGSSGARERREQPRAPAREPDRSPSRRGAPPPLQGRGEQRDQLRTRREPDRSPPAAHFSTHRAGSSRRQAPQPRPASRPSAHPAGVQASPAACRTSPARCRRSPSSEVSVTFTDTSFASPRPTPSTSPHTPPVKCSVSVFRRRPYPSTRVPGAGRVARRRRARPRAQAVGGSPLGDELVGATRNRVDRRMRHRGHGRCAGGLHLRAATPVRAPARPRRNAAAGEPEGRLLDRDRGRRGRPRRRRRCTRLLLVQRHRALHPPTGADVPAAAPFIGRACSLRPDRPGACRRFTRRLRQLPALPPVT